ncbi:hypothetical protein DUI87_07690 [Hirundo rustica rustica]|uniref:Uncharacterized protein n=1 Tax=Hirundo rustica rustica TaxID=333673 RepID=A0A3M0KQI4_HIRRU|nr:hypothetical protein DUI87_07690 [Hirundo rustica rustica]
MSTALVLVEDFSLPEINWEHHTAGTTQAQRFLKNLDDNFVGQVVRELTWKGSLLGLLLVNSVDLISEVEIGSQLGHSNHKEIKFKISVGQQDEVGHIIKRNMNRVEVFNTFFASVFNRDDRPRRSQCPELEDHGCENDQLPVKPEMVWDLLLQQTTLRGDPIAVYDIFVTGRGGADTDLFSVVLTHRTQGKGLKLCQGRFWLNIRERFFTQRVLGHWNRLPRESGHSTTLTEFKKCLDNALRHVVWG